MTSLKPIISQGTSEPDVLFAVNQISKHFGGIQALHHVSFSLKKGSIISLIGPNGAGKTTLINVATGIYAPDTGQVFFDGQDITRMPPYAIAYLGIARTFQLEELFPSLTVLENAMVGCHTRSRCGMFSTGLCLPFARAEERRIRDAAVDNLKMVGLEQRAHDSISNLPLGERKLVGIARALGLQPRLLMLDEPVGGLAAHESKRLVNVIEFLVDKGLTLLMVEHNMPFVMSISNRIVALDGGQKIAEGPSEDVRKDERVIRAYLGEEV
jgi:branched-chain amino acid transport system ATP-binding protein